MRRLKNGITWSWVAAAVVVVAEIVAGEVEERRAVEKEVALLGEEQRITREIGLPLIDFGLCEIGVDGEVGAQQRRRVKKRSMPALPSPFMRGIAAAGRPPRCITPYGLMSRPCPW